MGRIDIVVFPNGSYEIFGQIKSAPASDISERIIAFASGLDEANQPRKFTGYYDAPNASDMEWQAYDENNPIVMIPMEQEDHPYADDQFTNQVIYTPMELAQIPSEMRENILNGELHE